MNTSDGMSPAAQKLSAQSHLPNLTTLLWDI